MGLNKTSRHLGVALWKSDRELSMLQNTPCIYVTALSPATTSSEIFKFVWGGGAKSQTMRKMQKSTLSLG